MHTRIVLGLSAQTFGSTMRLLVCPIKNPQVSFTRISLLIEFQGGFREAKPMQRSSGHWREAISKTGFTSSKYSVSIRNPVNSRRSKQFHEELTNGTARFRVDAGADEKSSEPIIFRQGKRL
jgi:hypothetical protein